MLRYERRYWLIAACLAVVAGYVDALAFLDLGGFFVSFMSGNSTRAGVGLIFHQSHAVIAVSLIGAFVSGVVLGSFATRGARGGADERALTLVTLLLILAGILVTIDQRIPAIGFMAAAMGASNTTFQRNGEVSVGVTYMTGTLVKLGQRLADALQGGARLGWAPYLLLWLGLVTGAATGAIAYPVWGLQAIWGAVLAAGAIALTLHKLHA